MCEYALELATKEVESRYEKEINRAIIYLADDIIESAEPYDE